MRSIIAPHTPQHPPGGESFDSLSPWTPTLNDQRGAIAMAPLWKHPIAVLWEVIYPHGLHCNAAGVWDVVPLTFRVLVPRIQRAKGKGRADEDIGPYDAAVDRG